MSEKEKSPKKLTYFAKSPIPCPVCEFQVTKEDMLSGRGRLIAKDITPQLRREYLPIPGYGRITPMLFSIVVCPRCLTALFSSDFNTVGKDPKFQQEVKNVLFSETNQRRELILKIIKNPIDYRKPRTLLAGTFSYYLALITYSKMRPNISPSLKSSIAAIRFCWLLDDLSLEFPKSDTFFQGLKKQMIPKAAYYLNTAKSNISKGAEEMRYFGPDTDKDYGTHGLVYLSNLYSYTTLPSQNPLQVEQTLKKIKQELASIFGFGRASKDKPSLILGIVREFYGTVSAELAKLNKDQIIE